MFPNVVFISLFILVFAIFWSLLYGGIAWLSGWHKLAKTHYYSIQKETLTSLPFISIQLNNFGSYNNIIQISIHEDGFSLTPLLLFRPFHKPLFISWKEISTIKEMNYFFGKELAIYVNGNKIVFYGKTINLIKQGVQNRKYSLY